MPDLPEITQVISLSVVEYIDALTRASEAAVKFAEACDLAATAVDDLQAAIDGIDTAGLVAKMTAASTAEDNAAAAAQKLAASAAPATAATDALAGAEEKLAAAGAAAAASQGDLADEEDKVSGAALRAVNAISKLVAEQTHAGVSMDVLREAVDANSHAVDALISDSVELSAANSDLRKAIQAAAAEITADSPEMAAAIDDVVASASDAAAASDRFKQSTEDLRGILADAGREALLEAAQVRVLEAADRAAAAAAEDLAHAQHVSWAATTMLNAVTRESGVVTERSAQATKTLADAASSGAAQASGPVMSFWRTWGNVIHWVVAGSLEFLTVAVPALVALGAGMVVAAQGAADVRRHMTALYYATEATYNGFHQSIGGVLGLGNALQQAQNAANPGVYEILGAAANMLRSHMGMLASTGLQVVHMFDEFAARVTVDMQGAAGKQVSAFLAGMVTDLQRLGQVVGNIGHALLNFGSDMPGLAHFLLLIADGLSRVILFVSTLPRPLIMAAMGLEEMYRWGGLVATMLVRLTGQMGVMNAIAGGGGFIIRFGAAFLALTRIVGVAIMSLGLLVGRFAGVTAAAGTAGTAIVGFGARVEAASAASPAMAAGIAAVVAVLGYLVYKAYTVKDATQQWIAASDQAVAKASAMQVLPTIYNQLAQSAQKAASMTRSAAAQARAATVAFMQAGGAANPFAGLHTTPWADLGNHMLSLLHTAQTVRQNLSYLAGQFHTTSLGALQLANMAGVTLQAGLLKGSAAAKIADQQIRNLLTGMGLMQAPTGVVGADMTYLGIQSALAATHVQQLNSAFDQWLQTVTGGMSSFSQLQTALGSMSKDAAATSASLTGTIGAATLAAGTMKYTLKGMGQSAMQSWQQFTQAITQGGQLIDWLRTGMAAGVVGTGLYHNAIQALVGEMLHFTGGNRTAVAMLSQLARAAGGPTTTSLRRLEQWAGITGNAARNRLARDINAATIAMSNMSKVAQNLSVVVGSQMTAALASAIVNQSGLTQAYKQYAKDLADGAPRSQLERDLATIQRLQQQVATETNNATKAEQRMQQQQQANARQIQILTSVLRTYQQYLKNLTSQTWTVRISQFISSSYAGPGSAGHNVGSMTAGTGTGGGGGGGGGKHGHGAGVLGGGVGGLHAGLIGAPGAPAGGEGLHPSIAAALAGVGASGAAMGDTHVHISLPSPQEWTGATQTYVLQKSRRNGRNNLSLPPGRY